MGVSINTANRPIPNADDYSVVPPGYKRTEVGLIPVDWDVKTLNELGTFMKGKGIKRDDVTDDGFACIRYGEIYTRYNDYVYSFASRIPESVAQTAQPLKAGDLLFAGSGETAEEIGKCVAYLGEEEAYAGGDIVILRPVGQNSLYLGHLLNHAVVAEQKARYGQGDAVVHISARNLAIIRLPLPPTTYEQGAIAEVLSDMDGLIAALEKLIAKKQAIKQATMQQLLTGKTRLPGFTDTWNDTTIGAVADIRNGSTPSTQVPHYWNGSIPWCTPTDITGTRGKYLEHTARNITEAGLASCAASLLPPGTLLLCSRATIGELKIARTHVCTNQGFKSLVCHGGTSHEFLYYLIQTLKPQLIERAIGSTFLEIGKRDLAAIPLTIPLANEQSAIASVLSDMDAEIEALEQRRDKTQELKQGMMQQLLTGRVRLVNGEATA
ncbi:MAG: hypothetical protein GX937_04645 [Lentisphaerae bacterium]|jgi:type I restriction enzyme S subunit|nr:hypothetical protein [Lentisphaerota bacterium]